MGRPSFRFRRVRGRATPRLLCERLEDRLAAGDILALLGLPLLDAGLWLGADGLQPPLGDGVEPVRDTGSIAVGGTFRRVETGPASVPVPHHLGGPPWGGRLDPGIADRGQGAPATPADGDPDRDFLLRAAASTRGGNRVAPARGTPPVPEGTATTAPQGPAADRRVDPQSPGGAAAPETPPLSQALFEAMTAGAGSRLDVSLAGDFSPPPPEPPPGVSAGLAADAGLLGESVAIVENRGQWPAPAEFVAWTGSMAAAFTDGGIRLHLAGERPAQIDLTFEGASAGATLAGEGSRGAVYNFYLGNDPSRWRSNVAGYGSVRYDGLYEGIDVRVRDQGGRLEYDLLLDAGADLSRAVVRVDGAAGLEVAGNGALLVHTASGTLRQTPPVTWEVLPTGATRPVEAAFRILDGRRFGFTAPGRDPALPLVVDPGLEWSTFLAGEGTSAVTAVQPVRDGSGDVIVAGTTGSTDFPFAAGNVWYPGVQMFVARLNASGTGIAWASFLGGTNGVFGYQFNWGALAVDASGGAVIAGDTELPDHPTTPGAFDRTYSGGIDAWVARFDAAGGLVFSTFLGGTGGDAIAAVGFDPSGAVVVAGDTTSADFPTTAGAYDRTYSTPSSPSTGAHGDAFVTRLNAAGTAVTYSTYLGGHGFEVLEDMAIDAQGFVMVTGWLGGTTQTPFPTTTGAFDRTWNGSYDAFLSRLRLDGAGGADLKYSTFLGATSEERGLALAIDPNNRELVTLAGWTWSANFPTTAGVLRPTSGVTADGVRRNAFITRFRFPAAGGGSRVWSTYLGGTGIYHSAQDVVVGDTGDVIVSGVSGSADFPTTRGAYDRSPTGPFVSRLSGDGRTLLYSTFVGSSGEDMYGQQLAYLGGNTVVLAGVTDLRDFPTTPGVIDRVHGRRLDADSIFAPSGDGYVARLSLEADASGDLNAAAPTPLAPANGAAFRSGAHRVILDWNDVADPAGIDAYEYELSARSDFPPGWGQTGVVTESQALVPPIGGPEQGLALTQWFWRVRTYDRAGNVSAWSPTQSFTIGAAGAPVSLYGVAAHTWRVVQSGTLTGTVYLNGPAPAGGATVSLVSTRPDFVVVPASVTVPAAADNATFPIQVNPSDIPVWADLSIGAHIIATYGTTAVARAEATPPPENVEVSRVSFEPFDLTGGTPATGFVTLERPAPDGGAEVRLFSANPSLADVPATVTVPAGAVTAAFPIATAAPTVPVFVTIAAQRGPYLEAYRWMYVYPSLPVSLTSVTVSPSTVTAGTIVNITVTLSGPAPAQGAYVSLRSSDPSVLSLGSFDFITVEPGATSATVGFTAPAVSEATTVSLFAAYDAVTLTADLTITPTAPVPVASLALSPATVTGSRRSLALVGLAGPAPAGGQVVTLTSSNPAVASVPASVTIVGGMSSAIVDVNTSVVTADTAVTISASSGGVTRTALLTVRPAPTVSTLGLSPAAVTGGGSSTGTVTLSWEAPAGGAVVMLTSSDPAATVPPSVTVVEGFSSATFSVLTGAVPAPRSVTVSATYNGSTRMATLTVNPAGVVSVSALSLSPTSVTGGSGSTGTVTLSAPAPAGGTVVTLTSGTPSAATVPASVTVPAGATSATFPVTTSAVAASTPVTISASSGGATRPATLTVNPAAADAVAIQRAEYRASGRQLRVEATSSSAGATLRAYVTSTGALIGTLTHEGGGRYRGEFSWPTNPVNVTVRSSLGGSATRNVTLT